MTVKLTMLKTMVLLLPSILARSDPFGTPPPYTGAPPGSSSCVVTHTTGTFYMGPGQAKVIVDSTNSTCEGYLCDGNTGTATQELSMSATCTQGCVDVAGSTNYCKCRADCNGGSEPCDAQPCQNGGTCTSPGSGEFACACPAGYGGTICQTDKCTDYCLNGGTCVHDPARVTGVRCTCSSGYLDTRCQTARCDSATSPCYNGGECAMDPTDATWGFTCQCQGGFSGAFCQEAACVDGSEHCPVWAKQWQPSECDVNPAWMRFNCPVSCGTCGKCVDKSFHCPYWANGTSTSECDVNPGYMHHTCPVSCNTCAVASPCWADQSPCQNGGTCVHDASDTSDRYSCICPPGYQGTNCQTD
ncbi:fibropellin-1-like isoform X2 [Littorina saxatilis]